NTYQLPAHGNTAGSVIRRLLDGFRAAVRSLPWADAQNLHVSDYQIVTIASMIEREARIPGDRAKIAAVIYNRLKRGMSLGIDATVEYIDPNPSNGLTGSDPKTKSPYNSPPNPRPPP